MRSEVIPMMKLSILMRRIGSTLVLGLIVFLLLKEKLLLGIAIQAVGFSLFLPRIMALLLWILPSAPLMLLLTPVLG